MLKKSFLLSLVVMAVSMQAASDLGMESVENYAAIKKEKAIVVRPQYVTRYLPSKQYAPAVIFGLIAAGYHLAGRPTLTVANSNLTIRALWRLFGASQTLCLGSAALAYCVKHNKWAYTPAIISYLFNPVVTVGGYQVMPEIVQTVARHSNSLVPALLLGGHAYEVYQEEHADKSIAPEQELISVE